MPSMMPSVATVKCGPPTSTAQQQGYRARKSELGKRARTTGSITADLDGDGTLDTAEVRQAGLDVFWAVGDQTMWIASGGRYADNSIELVDLDPSDNQKEVVIRNNVYRLRDGRLHFLFGRRNEGSFAIGNAASKSDVNVTVVREGANLFLHIAVGDESVRARIDSPICIPSHRLLAQTLPDGRGALLIRIFDEQHRADVLLSRTKSGSLALHKPWSNTMDWNSTNQGIIVRHWHCGVLHEALWQRSGADFVATTTVTSGTQDARMCGVPQLDTADLDGDGVDETIALVAGALRVGASVAVLPKEATGIADVWRQDMPLGQPFPVHGWDTWEIVDIDKSDLRKELLLTSHLGEDSNLYFFFHYDGETLSAGAVMGISPPAIAGNGLVHERNGNCGQSITDTWKLKRGRLVLVKSRKRGRFDVDECAACPFVYRRDADSWQRKGEVLRNFVGAHRDGWQSLPVGPVQARTEFLELSIREEKPETTYLDAVYITIDDQRFFPLQCEGIKPPDYCLADGRFARIEAGDAIDLKFVIPTEQSGTAFVWAKGYYIPDPIR
tara:strand:+ start:32834 stop:34498 length:1665 start_codon:yes stop_codon:yes gene_type:complete